MQSKQRHRWEHHPSVLRPRELVVAVVRHYFTFVLNFYSWVNDIKISNSVICGRKCVLSVTPKAGDLCFKTRSTIECEKLGERFCYGSEVHTKLILVSEDVAVFEREICQVCCSYDSSHATESAVNKLVVKPVCARLPEEEMLLDGKKVKLRRQRWWSL